MKKISRKIASISFVMNLMIPGSGSLIGGQIGLGIGQLLLYLSGICLIIVGMIGFFLFLPFLFIFSGFPLLLIVFGFPLMTIAWIWALFTGKQYFLE